MNKNNKRLIVFSISVLMIGMFIFSAGIVAAQDTTTSSDSGYDFFANLKYKLSKFGLFTAEGQSRQCDINARQTYYVNKGESISKSQFLSSCGSYPSFLVDVFDSGWNFKGEYRSEVIGSGLSAGSDGQIWELYCCPYSPCDSNSDCSVSPASNYGNTCNVNYGSCYSTTPSHSTQLYNCNDGNWQSSGTATYGQDRFCLSSSDKNYLDQDGGEHCVTSPNSAWCESCDSHEEKKCYGGDVYWYDACGNREDKYDDCSSTETCSSGVCVQSSQPECSDITNIDTCYDRSDCMYTRFYTCKTLDDADCTGIREKDCVQDSRCEWSGTTCAFADSGDNGDNGDDAPELASTITWSEYYSNDDAYLIETGVVCLQTSDCEAADSGYTVSCIKNSKIQDRIWEGHKDVCKDFASGIQGHGILGKLIGGIINVLVNPCAYYADAVTFVNQAYSGQDPGVCIAESDSGVGKVWDKALNIVGGMGLPAQYVVIITIILAISLLVLLLQLIK